MIRNSLILLRNTPGAQAWRAASTVVDIPTSSIRSHLQDAEKAEATPGRRTAYLYFDSSVFCIAGLTLVSYAVVESFRSESLLWILASFGLVLRKILFFKSYELSFQLGMKQTWTFELRASSRETKTEVVLSRSLMSLHG